MGSATPRRLLRRATAKSPKATSPGRWGRVRQKGVEESISTLPFCLARGRKPHCPRKKKPVLQGFAAGWKVVHTGRVEDRRTRALCVFLR